MIKNNFKNLFTIIFLLFIFGRVGAQPTMEAGVATADCVGCAANKLPTQLLPTALVAEAQARLAGLEAPYQCAENQTIKDPDCLLIKWLHWKFETYTKNCREFFLDQNGRLGDYSKYLATLMLNDIVRNQEKSVFIQDVPDFEKFCPGFKDFSLIQKTAFHGWIFELTAFPESTCNVNVKPAKGVNDIAVCMYQLEQKFDNRYWRSKGTDPKHCTVSVDEIQTMKGCTGCAFDEYMRKLKKDGTPFGGVKDGKKIHGSYWASHNILPDDKKACMGKYPGKNKEGKPNWLIECEKEGHKPNWEWQARVNFFKRLPRFPLCKTNDAKIQTQELADFETARAVKAK